VKNPALPGHLQILCDSLRLRIFVVKKAGYAHSPLTAELNFRLLVECPRDKNRFLIFSISWKD